MKPNLRLKYSWSTGSGVSYDIHPEYRITSGTLDRDGPLSIRTWDVKHIPTKLNVGHISVARVDGARHPSVWHSHVDSPYHKNIGELAYKKLIGHYGSLKSDLIGSVSPEAQKTWERLGAKRLYKQVLRDNESCSVPISKLRPKNRKREDSAMFIKRAEPGFSSSSMSNLDDAWLHGGTGQILKNNGLSHNDAAFEHFGVDKHSALRQGHVRLQGTNCADGRPAALLKHRTKISGMIATSLRERKPFYLDVDPGNGEHYSHTIESPADHAKAWDSVTKHAMLHKLPRDYA